MERNSLRPVVWGKQRRAASPAAGVMRLGRPAAFEISTFCRLNLPRLHGNSLC